MAKSIRKILNVLPIVAIITWCLLQSPVMIDARKHHGDIIIIGGGGGDGGGFGGLGGLLTLGSVFGAFGDGDLILGRRRK